MRHAPNVIGTSKPGPCRVSRSSAVDFPHCGVVIGGVSGSDPGLNRLRIKSVLLKELLLTKSAKNLLSAAKSLTV